MDPVRSYVELRILTDRSPSNFSMTCIFVECNILYSKSLPNHGNQSKHVTLPTLLKCQPFAPLKSTDIPLNPYSNFKIRRIKTNLTHLKRVYETCETQVLQERTGIDGSLIEPIVQILTRETKIRTKL